MITDSPDDAAPDDIAVDRDEAVTVTWADGQRSRLPLATLREACRARAARICAGPASPCGRAGSTGSASPAPSSWTYVKTFDLRRPGARDVVPLVDDVASAALDLWAADQGLQRPVRSLAGV